jgi:hypothetical protein
MEGVMQIEAGKTYRDGNGDSWFIDRCPGAYGFVGTRLRNGAEVNFDASGVFRPLHRMRDKNDEGYDLVAEAVLGSTRPKGPTASDGGYPCEGNKLVRNKVDILEEAIAVVGGRGKSYGRPEDNFGRIAALWTVHLRNRYDEPGSEIAPLSKLPLLDAQDVAMMMTLMKLARLQNDPTHHDSWVDLAGYAACGGELAGNA